MRRHPEEVRQRALQLARQGVSAKQIGPRLGVHQTTVSLWLRRAGIGQRRSTKSRYEAAFRERVLAEYRKGRPGPDICLEFHIAQSSLSKWAARAGIARGYGARPAPRDSVPRKRRREPAEVRGPAAWHCVRCGLRGEHDCLPESASQLPVTGDGGGWLVEGCSRRGSGHR